MSKKDSKKQRKKASHDPSTGGMKNQWFVVIIALLAVVLYSNTLSHGYVLDDVSVISGNRHVMKGIDGLSDIWTTSYRDGYWNDSGTLYRPLTMSIFALQWQLAPENPLIPHWTNVLAYAFLCVLIFQLVTRLTKQRELAFFTSLLFTACTVHTEVVANIKSFDEILSMLLGVTSWLFILKWHDQKSTKHLAVALCLFMAGMFTKEGLISFLIIIPLSLYYFRDLSFKNVGISAALLCIPIAVYLTARSAVLGGITASLSPSSIDNPMIRYNLGERILTGFQLLTMYVQKLFMPSPLAYEYAYNTIPKAGLGDISVWLGLVLFVGLAYLAVKGLRSKSILGFSIAYFLISIALYTNTVVLIGAIFAERFLFFASLGWAMALALLFMKLKLKPLRYAIAGGLVLVYGGMSYARNPVWESSYTLYVADIETLENSCKAHYNLGLEIMKEKAMKAASAQERQRLLLEAKKEFEKAIAIKPGYHLPKGQIALVHYRLGNYAEAIERYEEALKHNPGDDTGWNNLAGALVATKQYEGAIECYEKAIALNPYYIDALGNCGAVNGMLGRHQEAIKYLERAVNLAPNNASYHQYLGLSYEALGNNTKAQQYFQNARRLKGQ